MVEKLTDSSIERRIYTVRGEYVMIDRDLADLYGVENRSLRQSVRRNMEKFPDDFLFKLTKEEANDVIASGVSQSVIPSGYNTGGMQMFAFTEQGLRSFSDTLRAYGKGIKKAPGEAGTYAAELFSKTDPDKEWVFCVKDNGGLSGRVIGVCSGRYVGNGPLGVYTAYLAVKRGFEKRGLTLSFRKWEIYGGGVRVYAQCPGLFDGGILISDSDSGKQAFSMHAVFGDPFAKGHTIISCHSLRHTSSMDPAQFCRERIPDMISEIREWSYRQKYTAAA